MSNPFILLAALSVCQSHLIPGHDSVLPAYPSSFESCYTFVPMAREWLKSHAAELETQDRRNDLAVLREAERELSREPKP